MINISPEQVLQLKQLLSQVKVEMEETQSIADEDKKVSVIKIQDAADMRKQAHESRSRANESDDRALEARLTSNLSQAVANQSAKNYILKFILLQNLGIDLDEQPEEDKEALLKELGLKNNFEEG